MVTLLRIPGASRWRLLPCGIRRTMRILHGWAVENQGVRSGFRWHVGCCMAATMKATTKRKLSVSRESLRRLNGSQLGAVHGGMLTKITDCSTQFSTAHTHCPCSVVDSCATCFCEYE
jgi:hypothetical protein